jgi:adenine deaminase
VQIESKRVSGNIVDVLNSRIYPGTIEIRDGRIVAISKDTANYHTFIMPGFVDAHVHVESSMLTPAEFARMASVHGTVATVSDPHEIANVLGLEGIRYMVTSGKAVPFKFFFGAPSCVPASPFDSSGASLGVPEVEKLLRDKEIRFLSEMMNFPGVLSEDPEVMAKIGVAKRMGKPVDGHAPGLRGTALEKYVAAGISTDHETTDHDEGLEKLSLGMKLLLREGSAAKNFETLAPLIGQHFKSCMLCSDDKHPDDLLWGHIDSVVKKALRMGFDIMAILQCACVNPVLHYGLDVGLLRVGDPADFIEVDDLEKLSVLSTYIAGEQVARNGVSLLPHLQAPVVNVFRAEKKQPQDFLVISTDGRTMYVIEAIDDQVLTGKSTALPKKTGRYVVSDTERDILKLALLNRYTDSPPAVGFVKNFGLQKGAIASSVAHDSHNIIAVGATDEELSRAVNLVVEHRGGISLVSPDTEEFLPLPIGGIMTGDEGVRVAEQYQKLDRLAKGLGSTLRAPFMTLSFMALLVIPKLKLGDRGLFDGEEFRFINQFL